jgi:hypothetical protein
LLASSFLSSKGYRLDVPLIASSEIEADLKKLESTVIQLLNLAMTYGKTCIITNAETGWVQLSAQKFLPGVVPLLSKIRVLSARSTFEARFPDSPHKWKYHAFTENIHELLPLHMKRRGDRNIMSFGDSHVEREAVQAVTKYTFCLTLSFKFSGFLPISLTILGRDHPETLTKSIKFVERPSMEQLWRQLELVTNCFKDICNHDGDLDLMLTISLFS